MQRAPHPAAPGLAVSIDEPMIRRLVDTFYGAVRRDPMLGPVFNSRIHDWDEHLDKLAAFWSSVTLMTGRYKGRPMPAHIAIAEITEAHFMRWLALFRVAAAETCPPAAAAFFVERAERIAESLYLGVEMSRGHPPGLSPPKFSAPKPGPEAAT